MKAQATLKQLGFTLVELAIVIVVIGILASIVIVSQVAIQHRAANTEAQGDLRRAAIKIESYKANAGGYPLNQSLVDSGKGLPKSSSDRVYDYFATNGTFCVSTMVARSGKTFKIESSDATKVVEGSCTTTDPISLAGSESASTGSTNSAALAVSKPSATQAGDVLLMVATMVEGSRATADFEALSGWTLLDSKAVTSPNKVRQSVWYKVASASEPTSYTVNAVAGSSCKMAATVSSFRSVDAASPIMAHNYNVDTTTTATAAYGSVTATGNSYLVAVGGGRGTAAYSSSAPAMSTPYTVASSARTAASSYMYSYMGVGETLISGNTKTPPNMTYEGTMSTNMTYSVLLRQRTTP